MSNETYVFEDILPSGVKRFKLADKSFYFRTLTISEGLELDSQAGEDVLLQVPILVKILNARAIKNDTVDEQWVKDNSSVPILRRLIFSLSQGRLPGGDEGKD